MSDGAKLYLQRYLADFVRNPRRRRTVFATQNSFHRRLVHQECERLGLHHSTFDGVESKYSKQTVTRCPICHETRCLSFGQDDDRERIVSCNSPGCGWRGHGLRRDDKSLHTQAPRKLVEITK
jgi:hypothetical protein